MSVATEILDWAASRPDHPALCDRERSLNFADLSILAGRATGCLASNGIERGDRVGICLKDDFIHLAAIVGLASRGATLIAFDWRAQPAEIDAQIDEFAISAVLCDLPDRQFRVRRIDFDEGILRDQSAAAPSEFDDDVPFVINVTSGTTGRPKGLMLSHRQYLSRYAVTRRALGWGDGERYLSAGHMAFTATRNCCLFHLLSGNTVVLFPPLHRSRELVAAIERHRATAIFVVPTQARSLLDIAGEGAPLLPDLRYLWLTGSALQGREKRALAERVNANLYDEYGASGFGTIACLQPADIADRADTVGRPAGGIEVQIVDEEDRPLPAGATGRLRCRMDGMATAFTDPGTTGHEFFRDGWYYSGELARLDDEGYLHLRGRASDLIITGGNNVNPEEVEAVLRGHPDIADVAVLGLPDPKLGERVVACVVAGTDLADIDILRFCRTRLSAYKVPTSIVRIPTVPRGIAGKIQRQRLRDQVSGGGADQRDK